jgi:hypothetical protein
MENEGFCLHVLPGNPMATGQWGAPRVLLATSVGEFQPWVLVGGLGLLLLLVAFLWGYRATRRPFSKPAASSAPRTPTDSGGQGVEAAELGTNPEEILEAVDRLHAVGATVLVERAGPLLHHPNGRVRHRVLGLVGKHLNAEPLRQVALTDDNSVLRELASQLLGQRLEADELLTHPDLAVRTGALRGRLEVAPTDARAQACLAATVASADNEARFMALALFRFLTPEQQATLVANTFHSSEVNLVQAAVEAIEAVPNAALAKQLVAMMGLKTVRAPAVASLLRMGDAALAALAEALRLETDGRLLRVLANTCAQFATPAARHVLVRTAQTDNLPQRAAALQALLAFATVPEDASVFRRVVEDELRLAQQLLCGMASASAELDLALRYELGRTRQRLFQALLQVYERPRLLDAQRAALHLTGERQALALEALQEVLPRPLYQGVQALVDGGRIRDKIQDLDDILGPFTVSEPIQTTIVRRGSAAFSAWTIGVALREWRPRANTVLYLYQHLHAPDRLIEESARALLRQLPQQRPAAYEQLLLLHPDVSSLLMNASVSPLGVSAQERVLLLKGTALFAETPENVLGTVVPIMREVSYAPGAEIFAKGMLGTSLFLVCEGEVDIFNGGQRLTTFRKGDFFGELALLDAEPRSATAVARGAVVALRLDQDEFFEMMEDCPEVLRNILRVLCQRLRRQNEKMSVAE